MGIKDNCELWEDVFDESLDDELAPEIDQVANEEFASKISPIYTDSVEFFKRTYFSPAMLDVLEKLVATLKGKGGVPNVYAIYSLFGGGKTHTLLTIYHAFHNPRALVSEDVLKDMDDESARRVRKVAEEIESLSEDAQIVVVYGKDHSGKFGGGTPSRPVDWGAHKTHTVWGMIAHHLGNYEIMRGDDENNTAPSTATLSSLFEGKKVLILMDELVELAHNLAHSKNEDERRYANNLPTFVERITKAVHGTNSAIVVTMPFEVKNGALHGLEKWYAEDLLKTFWRALKNVGETISPLVHTKERDDIVKVLRKRIFKSVQVDSEAIRNLKRAYGDYKNVFGEFEEPYMEDYYPFHPDFVSTLRDIVEKAELQKTRDMLALTRFVVRKLWDSKDNPSFIMLWHIDPSYPKISSKLFQNTSLSSYLKVYGDDVIEGVKKVYGDGNPRAKLAAAVLTTIFLKTYYYDSHDKMKTFPTKFHVARMVYEPTFFNTNQLNPTKIIDTLDNLRKSMEIVYLYTTDGYYWFWKSRNIKAMVDSEAKKLIARKAELDTVVREYTDKLMKGEVKVGNVKKSTVKKIFKVNDCIVLKDLNAEIEDTKKYVVVFAPWDNIETEDLKRLTFRAGASSRKYRNTMTIVFLRNNTLNDIRKTAAHLKACDVVAKQIKKGKDKNLAKIQKEMVTQLKDDIEEELIRQLMSNYSKISYPTRKNDMDDVAVIDAPESGANLLDMVYNALRKPDVGKIAENASTFDELSKILNVMSIDLSLGSEQKSIREILEWFYTNPWLPFVDSTDVLYALQDGVKDLKIGLRDPTGKVHFAKIFDKLPDEVSIRGEVPSKIDESWVVLPSKKAAKEFVESLIKEDGKIVGDKIIRYYLYIDRDAEPLSISEIGTPDDLVDYLTTGYVVKEIQEAPKDKVKITLTPSSIGGKPGDIREVEVLVELVEGTITEEVTLKVPVGEINPSSGTLPLRAKWAVKIPDGSDTNYFTLKAYHGNKEIYSTGGTLTVTIESIYTVVNSVAREHRGMKLVAIGGITDINMLDTIKGIGKLTVEGDATFSNENLGTITITLNDLEGTTAFEMLSLLRDAIGAKSMNLTAKFKNEVEINDTLISRVQNIKAQFKIKR